MQKLSFLIHFTILFIEAILWTFLAPPVAKAMIAFLGLIFGLVAGEGLKYPWGAAFTCFGIVFVMVPGKPFVRLREMRVDWWRRRIAQFPETWRILPTVLIEAKGPF